MENIKRVGLWLAFIVMIIVKIPLYLIQTLVTNINLLAIALTCRIVEEIGNEDVDEGWDSGMDSNIKDQVKLIKLFKDMKMGS